MPGLTWAMCVCSIVLDKNEYVHAHAESRLPKVGKDKIFSGKLPLPLRRRVENTVSKVRCLFQLNQGSPSCPFSHLSLIRDERV